MEVHQFISFLFTDARCIYEPAKQAQHVWRSYETGKRLVACSDGIRMSFMDNRMAQLSLGVLLLGSGLVLGTAQRPADPDVQALTYRVRQLERDMVRIQSFAASKDGD